MRKEKYEDHARKMKAKTAIRARLENEFKTRTVRQRPRDPLKEKLLLELDKKRWERAIKDGSIKILGKRKVRISL
ncbi:hypothetical protein ACFLQ8_01200 [Candidatus Auribacterota bacterium]